MAASAITVVDAGGPAQFTGLFSRVFAVSCTINMASVASGSRGTDTIAVPGVALGDIVLGVSFGVSQAGVSANGYVDAAGSVTVVIVNNTGGAVDLASTTVKVLVARAAF